MHKIQQEPPGSPGELGPSGSSWELEPPGSPGESEPPGSPGELEPPGSPGELFNYLFPTILTTWRVIILQESSTMTHFYIPFFLFGRIFCSHWLKQSSPDQLSPAGSNVLATPTKVLIPATLWLFQCQVSRKTLRLKIPSSGLWQSKNLTFLNVVLQEWTLRDEK